MKISQVTSKENLKSNLPQAKIMEDLDRMSKEARKIKEKKKKNKAVGHLDTQLFPEWWKKHPMKAEASNKARAAFFENKQDSLQSYWNISFNQQEVSLKIGDLFPSGQYDIHQIKDKDFGIGLILRLTAGDLVEESDKLTKENTTDYHDISLEDFADEEKINNIISNAIPLNDYQKNIRDSLETRQNGH